jgi:hypothetical protein
MIAEDIKRPNEATAQVSDTKLVRRLPVISELFLNPRSHSFTLQEARVVAMASPKENPWYARLMAEYLGKILFDAGYQDMHIVLLYMYRYILATSI